MCKLSVRRCLTTSSDGKCIENVAIIVLVCVLFVAVLKILNVLLCCVKHGKLVVELLAKLIVLQLK